MRTLFGACALLLAAALLIACGGDEQKQSYGNEITQAEPAVAGAEATEVPALASEPAPEATEIEAAVESAGAAGVLAKSGDTLFVGTSAGLVVMAGGASDKPINDEIVAVLPAEGQTWVATPSLVRTLDGSTQVVPDFAVSITGLAASGGEVFVGTAGDGVWKLSGTDMTAMSPEWDVIALQATDFGLFAATSDGLFSFDGDKWHRRHLGDSSDALAAPSALYYRYPYLYVGDATQLLRYDGGAWETFADIATAEISALGWHNARLYIGAEDGSLRTLEGMVVEDVPAPGPAPVYSVLRYDGRLHVAAGDGLYRYKFGRYEKLDLDQPTNTEPETEPIASL